MDVNKNQHLPVSDAELPKAVEVNFTPEELEFIGCADECPDEETGTNDKKAFSMSKGAVGAAVVGNSFHIWQFFSLCVCR
jgi:hypothetical protein